MKFAISSVLFKKIIDAVKDVVKDTSLEISPDGIVLNAMDSSHVSLIHMIIKSSLSEFSCDNNEVIGINTETLAKILKTCDNEAEIVCENKDSKLTLLAKSRERNMNFSQNLLDLEMDTMMVPDMEFPCEIEMPCAEFQKICRDLREFGEDVRFTISPTMLKFYTTSGGEHIEVDYSTNSSIKIHSEAYLEMSYSLKYLILFCKACALSDIVYIYVGMEQPMRLKFPISDTEHLSFYLAPKVDE
jgi:proliferating cell nuclear antigen